MTYHDRADADTIHYLRHRVERAEAARGPRLSINDRARLEKAIAHVTPVYSALSLPVPGPRADENAYSYRRRIVEDLKSHHAEWRKTNPGRITDPEGFALIEREVLAAATARGLDPTFRGHVSPGQLRERKVADASGNEMTVFHGDPADAWAPFCGPMKTAVTEIRTPGGRRLYPRG